MNCSLLTPRVLRWLRDERPVRVLNLFEKVCNLVNDRNDVISLVSADVGPGPFSMVVDVSIFERIDLDLPITIDFKTQALSIGSQTIEYAGSPIWNPKPDWNRLDSETLLDLPLPQPAQPELIAPLEQTITGIVEQNYEYCQSGARRLAGLGQGQTPAGDDMLVGLLYGLWAWRPLPDLSRMIVETAAPRTTTLSAAFLRAAMDGEATIHWHDLVEHGPQAVNQILSIGATSGRDAWTGFMQLGHQLSHALN